MSAKRVCYYANESFAERNGDGTIMYHMVKITEGEPGYVRVSIPRADLEVLRHAVDKGNAQLGLDRDEVLDIVASSMAAGSVE